MKTSISLEQDLIRQIDDYRRHQNQIPNRSQAIKELIKIGLKHTTVPKK